MTGKYVHRIGVWDNSASLSSNEPTWAHRLNLAGYETALAGKMHFIGEDQRHGFQRRLVSDIHGKMHRVLTDWDSQGRAGTRPATASGSKRPAQATTCTASTTTA